jgi:hypothetical protein
MSKFAVAGSSLTQSSRSKEGRYRYLLYISAVLQAVVFFAFFKFLRRANKVKTNGHHVLKIWGRQRMYSQQQPVARLGDSAFTRRACCGLWGA